MADFLDGEFFHKYEAQMSGFSFKDIDPWDVARRHYEKQTMMFMSRLLRHFGVTQVELPMYPVSADEVLEMRELPEKGAVFYRIKGQLKLDGDGYVGER